jgi:IS4 transposase
MLGSVFEAFLKASPVSVLYRAAIERALSPERLDALFARTAERQRVGELMFSTCVDLMTLVVARVRKSVHAAHRAHSDRLGVSVRSLYNKLAGIEPCVTEELVAATAADLAAVMAAMKALRRAPLAGYEVRVLDGNYLGGTEHRLAELRPLGAAALPGMTLCLYDPQRNLVNSIIACEDGHANERGLIGRVLLKAEPGQCWVADRNFSVCSFLFGLSEREAYFVVRQHPQLVGQPVGRVKKGGRAGDAALSEQSLRVTNPRGETLLLRRVSLHLAQPTRFGDREVHLLTNLPAGVTAGQVAGVYRDRWSIETAFMHLATVLRSEVNTLGYPDAALFAFGIGLLLYNVLALLEAAVETAQPRRACRDRRLSPYYLADEISGVYRGMMIAVPPPYWRDAFAGLSPAQFARELLAIARRVEVQPLLANPPPKKTAPTPKTRGTRGAHVATQRLLQKRKSR